MAAYVRGTTSNDVATFQDPTQYYADAGDDIAVGSQYTDSLNGAAGNDKLLGRGGKDYITGGKGVDMMHGGKGNDDFLFSAGDLVHTITGPGGLVGKVDNIFDFHGAGGYKAYLGVEDDFLTFKGFGVGSHIDFIDEVGGPRNQLYFVTDTANPANSGYILIHMADGTDHLAKGDYQFLNPVHI